MTVTIPEEMSGSSGSFTASVQELKVKLGEEGAEVPYGSLGRCITRVLEAYWLELCWLRRQQVRGDINVIRDEAIRLAEAQLRHELRGFARHGCFSEGTYKDARSVFEQCLQSEQLHETIVAMFDPESYARTELYALMGAV